MNVSFFSGEKLTASKLNALAASVGAGGWVDSAGGNTQPTLPTGAPFNQRHFTSYVPPLCPVYVDKASPVIGAPVSGGEGWFYRGGPAGDYLTPLPGAGLGPASVWEKTTTNSAGYITDVEMGIGSAPAEQSRVPGERGGIYVRYVGALKKNQGKAGFPSAVWEFFDYRRPIVPPTLVGTQSPSSDVISLVPPGGNYDPSETSNVSILTMQTDGGIVHSRAASSVSIAPRFELVAAPDTAVVAPETGFAPYTAAAPGSEWQVLGRTWVQGGELTLSAQWVRPWKARFFLNYSGGAASTTQTLVWKKSWGLPPAQPPGYQVDFWSTTSRVEGVMSLDTSDVGAILTCWVSMHDYVVLEGTGAIITQDQAGVVQRGASVLLRAFLRRTTYPATGSWEVWNDSPLNDYV